jgi:hypothetical protein
VKRHHLIAISAAISIGKIRPAALPAQPYSHAGQTPLSNAQQHPERRRDKTHSP